MDRSVSLGFVVKGGLWGRAKDRLGIAASTNRLSNDHAVYSAAGGLGVTIGDGRLSYAGEKIVETYYAIGLGGGPHNALTFNYQFIENPAYNSDRGPVSIFAVRLHGEF